LKKKLLALPKEKDCDIIQPWMKSIVNHLYWTAASSPDQDWELMLAKWKSLCNHIINVHNGYSPLYASCEHGELEGR
jgi:solute carrier family 8 (sodium/calcium exchanger)